MSKKGSDNPNKADVVCIFTKILCIREKLSSSFDLEYWNHRLTLFLYSFS